MVEVAVAPVEEVVIVAEGLWIHVVGLDDAEAENGLVLDWKILAGAYLRKIWLIDTTLTSEKRGRELEIN